MQIEIEHKYLVLKDLWLLVDKPDGIRIKQGYLLDHPQKTIRVRLKGDQGFITIKGPMQGASRAEFEYPIPSSDAEILISSLAISTVEKIRYLIHFAGKKWEVDEFVGKNKGLVLAEIELNDPEEKYQIPPWAGENVTQDPRYYNSYLAKTPYTSWI